MESCYDRLTDEEKERNKHGPMHVFIYTEDNLGNFHHVISKYNKIQKLIGVYFEKKKN